MPVSGPARFPLGSRPTGSAFYRGAATRLGHYLGPDHLAVDSWRSPRLALTSPHLSPQSLPHHSPPTLWGSLCGVWGFFLPSLCQSTALITHDRHGNHIMRKKADLCYRVRSTYFGVYSVVVDMVEIPFFLLFICFSLEQIFSCVTGISIFLFSHILAELLSGFSLEQFCFLCHCNIHVLAVLCLFLV